MNNLRQIGFHFEEYLSDFNGDFFSYTPNGSAGWYNGSTSLDTFARIYLGIEYRSGDYFAGTLLDCPSNQSGYAGKSIDYAYNFRLFTDWGGRNGIKKTSKTVTFADTRGKGQAVLSTNGYYFFYTDPEIIINYDLHMEHANHLFMDNHVESACSGDAMEMYVFKKSDE
jgi:hypothetical protein